MNSIPESGEARARGIGELALRRVEREAALGDVLLPDGVAAAMGDAADFEDLAIRQCGDEACLVLKAERAIAARGQLDKRRWGAARGRYRPQTNQKPRPARPAPGWQPGQRSLARLLHMRLEDRELGGPEFVGFGEPEL